MIKLSIKIIFSIFFISSIIACTDSQFKSSRKSASENLPKKEKILNIGLIPERNIFKQMERYEPLFEYISKKTGLKINSKILTRYGNIIDNFESLGLDGAFLGSFTFTLANAKMDLEVIARPENLQGVTTYHGLIFTRSDSGIRQIKDMKGKSFAFVDKATTAGHLFPLAYFKENGIEDYRTYFKETYYAGTHEDTIYDVLNGKADMGAAKNTVFEYLLEKDPAIGQKLSILSKSPDVPQNALAFRKAVDSTTKENFKQTVLNMHKDPEGIAILKNFGATRFVETTQADYSAVYQLIEKIGMDLKSYSYLNE